VLNVTCRFVCLLYISGSGIDVRSECLRKLSSHVPMFELGRDIEADTGLGLNPDSEVCIESTAHLFGIHPFYIPKGRLLFVIVSEVVIATLMLLVGR